MNFTFITTSQYRTVVSIESDGRVKDLIKLYFESIGFPHLFGDKSIRFLWNGRILSYNKETLIEDNFKKSERML